MVQTYNNSLIPANFARKNNQKYQNHILAEKQIQ